MNKMIMRIMKVLLINSVKAFLRQMNFKQVNPYQKIQLKEVQFPIYPIQILIKTTERKKRKK